MPSDSSTTSADAWILERLGRFLDLAGPAPADSRDRDEVRRRALMQLDLEDAARHREVTRSAAHVASVLGWYPDPAEMADWPAPWPTTVPVGGETAGAVL